jgi:hypothetical protein
MPDNAEGRKTKRTWLVHPTPDDDAIAADVKRMGGHMTLADAIRVALRRYRTDLHKDARAAGTDLQPKTGT